MKRLLLIELNEFNVDLLSRAVKLGEFPGIEKLLSMKHSHSWTDDQVEHKGLDPWVQWVSVHTGRASEEHRIKHLGDVPSLDGKQLWEKLSEMGISTAVFGAMNASRGDTENCHFFFPDPWTFSEPAHPPEMNALLEFPRYYSKNYLDLNYATCARGILKMLAFVLTDRSFFRIFMRAPLLAKGALRFGLKSHVLFSGFDVVVTQLFIERMKSKPQFALIFLNSIAHLQHHIWPTDEKLSPACLYSLSMIDRALRDLFESCAEDQEIVVMNGLGQVNIAATKSDTLYRQKNPEQFLRTLGLRFKRVEQLMTNDAHVLFENSADAKTAVDLLASATLIGKPAFDIDYDPATPTKVFYQLDVWDRIDPGELIRFENMELDFYEPFEAVVTRTGEHIQRGDIFTRNMQLPETIHNHDMYHTIVDYFDSRSANA